MISALDSNVLIDLLGPPTKFTDPSIAALDDCHRRGALIVCPVVIAELAAYSQTAGELKRLLEDMHLGLVAFSWDDLHAAGDAYVRYCRRSGRPKTRMLADFLIAGHAEAHADALVTRDRGYYSTYFPKLRLIEPGE
ncbi:MAG: type II toxin-antitoxin system VapC family toxin [Chthoniobacterales bacterium]